MAAEYRDPRPLAVAAILWTWIWLGAQALYGAVSAFSLAVLLMAENVRVTMQLATSDWKLATIAVLSALPSLVSGFLVLRWIYRTNANAQVYSSGMNVSPAWNVCFFFVPIANLWKPYEGVRQSWEVSNMHDQRVPAWVRWWWACWLATNFMFCASYLLARQAENAHDFSFVIILQILGSLVSAPLALLLIRLIRTLTAAQEAMHREESFV